MKIRTLIIYIAVLSYLGSNQLFATNDNLLVRCLHYENASGEKGKTTFFYSEDNKKYKEKWELLDGSRYSINYLFLDQQGNMIRKYREFSDSLTSNNFYKYDYQGNLIEDYFERSDGIKGVAWYKYQDGKKIEAECRGLNGWFYGIIKYEYSNNKISKGIIYREGREIGRIDYAYNDQGYLITEFWDFGGKWSQTFTYEYFSPKDKNHKSYTYSSPFLKETKEYIVKTENYDWNNEKGGPSIYEYEGNKLLRKIYKYDSLETVTTYEYDRDGLLMKSFRSYSDGRKAVFSYHYNENRQLIRRLFQGDNGFEGTESYEYDIEGRLIKADWSKFDTWLTGTLTFNYDENNRLKSGFFEGKDGFDADINFEEDINKNITKINWKFTFGKTQTYWFEYDKL